MPYEDDDQEEQDLKAGVFHRVGIIITFLVVGYVLFSAFDHMMKKDAESQCRVHHYDWCRP